MVPGYSAGDILNSVTLSVTINQTILTVTIQNTSLLSERFRFTSYGSYAIGGNAPDTNALNSAINVFNPIFFLLRTPEP